MKLSIITISLNNISGLRLTAESILEQTYDDYEWIVIDGGSHDGTREFLEASNKNITFWCSEKDKGIYNAMNKGIARAKGDYILFLNSGDTLYRNTTLQEALEKCNDYDIVYGDAMFMHKKGARRWVYDDILTMKRMYEHSINHQSTFIKASLLKLQGYDESYHIAADWKRFVEWLKEGKTFKHIDIIIANYDTTGLSTTNEDIAHAERDRFFKELYTTEVVDVLKDWLSFQNKPCILTRRFCNSNRLYRRLIRSNLHFISWIDDLKKWVKRLYSKI